MTGPVRPSALRSVDVDALLGIDFDVHRAPVVRALASLVAGGSPRPVVVGEIDSGHRLRRMARRHGTNGLLLRAVEDGAVVLQAEVIESLRRDVATMAAQLLALDRAALEIADVAATHDADITFLKGVATSRLDHAAAADRGYVDVDALVRVEDHDRLLAALKAADHEVHLRGPADGPTFFKGTELRSPSGVGIDLHTRLFRQGAPGRDGWRTERSEFTIGSTRLHALSAPWRQVHAAGHLVFTPIGERKHNAVVDVVRLLETTELAEVLDAARSVGVHAAVAWGVAIGADLAGIDVDHDLLDRDGSARDLRSIATRAAFLGSVRHPGREQLAHMTGVRPRDRLRLVRALVFPPAEYRAYWEARGRPSQLRHLAERLRRR